MADSAPLAIYDVMVAVRRCDGTRDVTIATVRRRTLLSASTTRKRLIARLLTATLILVLLMLVFPIPNGHSIPS